jgi:two-component system, NtrC family, sensor kinase
MSDTILIVDDSLTVREALAAACADAGYRTMSAASGEEGLRLAALERPRAALIDGQLPGIDGATVIRRIRLDAALRGLPCMLLTDATDRAAELRALDAGADAFARKEEGVEIVLAKLAVMLRRAAAPASEAASLVAGRKILAVDDSPTYLNELGGVLLAEGYDAVLASSGEAALELLAVQPVDCVLLDLAMPGLGGTETCRRIKAAPVVRDIPLIILTASEERAAMLDGLAAGADDYVPKSSEFEVLKARIRAQIRRKQFEDENRRIREELLRSEIEATEARAARELAETRAALVEELERKNRELEAFSYSVSHDLRGPLRRINSYSQIMLEDCAASLDDTARAHLARIRDGGKRMAELIEDMLQLSRIGRAELKRAPVDLTALARAVAAELRHQDPAREAQFLIEDGLRAEADRGLLRIVLENLLGNAWKFTGKTQAARIAVGARVPGSSPGTGQRAFFVEDNGAGFDMAHAAKLFAPFQRLHSEAEFSGTGIGLATVQRAIDRHGGRVWAEGAAGRGATFYFTLPPAKAERG